MISTIIRTPEEIENRLRDLEKIKTELEDKINTEKASPSLRFYITQKKQIEAKIEVLNWVLGK